PGYFGNVQNGLSDMDAAVDELVAVFGGEQSDDVAARIGLLVQAHDATGGLVTRVPAARHRLAAGPLAAVLLETLRHDPPVPTLRRECLVDHDRPGHGRMPAGAV